MSLARSARLSTMAPAPSVTRQQSRTVNGLEMTAEDRDFDFGEGHFIRVDFLTRALDGTWEWDDQEETLMIRVP